ncbi:MAG: tyrosine-protein phosphatase [Clostridia bacterium]|nr:tyrosine-protein phosphatase [Clostridia bacterium]
MKHTRLLSFLLALLLLSSSLFGCGTNGPEPAPAPDQTPDKTEEPAITVSYELLVPSNTLHSTMQDEYLNSKNYNSLTDFMNGSGENSRPQLLLKWEHTVTGAKASALKECVVISKDDAFSDPVRMEASGGRLDIGSLNLELGETLYWYVEGTIGKEVFKSQVETLKISENAPRNLYVDGVTNCRDLGGWETKSGGTTKQGQLFRTGRFSKVTSSGKEVLLNQLGVKTEIDLRTKKQVQDHGDSTEESALGSSVNYYFLPMEYENISNILTASVNKDSLLKVFEVLGDEANYPIAFHCSIGTDRTGMIAFLVLGLCGVSKKDLYRDYLFSGFGKIDKKPSIGAMDRYLETVGAAEGSTLAEKVENYLLSIGVKAEQIATVQKMMK